MPACKIMLSLESLSIQENPNISRPAPPNRMLCDVQGVASLIYPVLSTSYGVIKHIKHDDMPEELNFTVYLSSHI